MISEKREKMETVLGKHVQTSGNSTEPPFEEQNDSFGSSNDDSSEEATDGVTNNSDGEEAEHKDEGGDEEGDDHNANAGWAEVMAKILGKKTPESQTSILLKNKELDKVKEEEQQEKLQRKKQVDKRRAWEMMCRKKPDIVKDRETERALQRIATRGVVQLFNAVRKHQNAVNDKVKEAGGSERKKAKLLSSVSKKDFIDVLRRTEGGGVISKTEKDTVAAAEEKPAWSVLRDDFMMGASMKDWDKESDKDEPTNSGGEAEESD